MHGLLRTACLLPYNFPVPRVVFLLLRWKVIWFFFHFSLDFFSPLSAIPGHICLPGFSLALPNFFYPTFPSLFLFVVSPVCVLIKVFFLLLSYPGGYFRSLLVPSSPRRRSPLFSPPSPTQARSYESLNNSVVPPCSLFSFLSP